MAITIDHTGKVAFVTGAGAGIGREIARWLARAGAAVAVADVRREKAASVAAEIESEGGTAHAIVADPPRAVEDRQGFGEDRRTRLRRLERGRGELLCQGRREGRGKVPLILAEELDADWSKVKIVTAPPVEAIYGNPGFQGMMYTAGSNAVTSYYTPLRIFGAQVRLVLLDNAI